jgi:negative regulator of sigma E activity
MNTDINQKISSFLDGELQSSEEEAILIKMRKDSELANRLNHYQMVSQVLKNDTCIRIDDNFLNKIKDVVDEEPHYLLPKNKVSYLPTGLWRKTSLAIAASTIFAVVLVSQKVGVEVSQPANAAVIAQKSVQPDSMRTLVKTETQIEVAGDLQAIQQHERLKAYLKERGEHVYPYSPIKPRPYVRIVSQE